ncbi:hypothetical protein ABZS81_25165 [Streptomyces sp. NPDC005318]|uniref:hypothetical protein n=1 Tax=Streptomyces sp. NPDC005318 TaxID=3157031 RepID=UPI0033A0967A
MSSDRVAQENEALLIREAMAEASEGAPPLPDLVPVALAQGRRRRARARVAIGAGVTGVLALGVFGAMLPSWGAGGGTATGAGQIGAPAPRSSDVKTSAPSTGPSRRPVHIEPTPGQSSMADLPATERRRQEQFQQQAAVLFDELLPPGFGTVRPVDLTVSRYQGGAKGDVFPLVFSVRPGGDAANEQPCPDTSTKVYQCKEAELPGGIVARAITWPSSRPTAAGNAKGDKTITGVNIRFVYGDSTVVLAADGDDSSMVSAPVTADQLLGVAGDSRFLELVRYADSFPMEPKQESVRGG